MIQNLLHDARARLAAFAPTPRERAGLAIVALIVAGVLLAGSFDWATSALDRAHEARDTRVNAADNLARLTDKALQLQLMGASKKIGAWSIVDDQEPIAKVRAANDLESLAQGAGVSNVEVNPVNAETGAAGIAGLKTFDFEISGDFTWQSFEALLAAFEQAQLSAVPVSVAVSQRDEQKRFTLVTRVSYLPGATP